MVDMRILRRNLYVDVSMPPTNVGQPVTNQSLSLRHEIACDKRRDSQPKFAEEGVSKKYSFEYRRPLSPGKPLKLKSWEGVKRKVKTSGLWKFPYH